MHAQLTTELLRDQADLLPAQRLELARSLLSHVHTDGEHLDARALGDLFEQSLAEAGPRSRRQTEGVYYTPSYVTHYIVEETLGRTLRERWSAILSATAADAEPEPGRQQQKWIAAWERYRTALCELRILDLACGAGAFLIAAFDHLASEHARVDRALLQLRPDSPSSTSPPPITSSLFGIDINRESVELAKLALWMRASAHGQELANLDRNLRWGNSVVDDPAVDPAAFDWQTAIPSASAPASPPDPRAARFWQGFDIVLGNPPYVRHELIRPYKRHWQQKFASYHGAADLFVYCIERGLSALKPRGRLGCIVTNKWLRAEYGGPLRGLLASACRIETLSDFGHAPVFRDADTSPCVLTLCKETPPPSWSVAVTRLPAPQVHPIPQQRLGKKSWSLEPETSEALLDKIRRAGIPLGEYASVKPYRGVVTGCNAAFLIDSQTREQLVQKDPRSAQIIHRYLRGQDLLRWHGKWDGTWMIFARHGIAMDDFPAVKAHLAQFHSALLRRKKGSYKWYEIQDSVSYWPKFSGPKIIYQEIQFHPYYGIDDQGLYLNNKAFFIPTADRWLLAVLNSPLMWWYTWRTLPHLKDEALSPTGKKMIALPIARPSENQQAEADQLVPHLLTLTAEMDSFGQALRTVLRDRFGIAKPGSVLSAPEGLAAAAFVQHAWTRTSKPTAAPSKSAVRALLDLHKATVAPVLEKRATAARGEKALAALVYDAYGLTPADVAALWQTAPPRMPVGR